MITLITRSDDLGLNEATNAAICRAADAGFVRNVSVLATVPALESAAKALAGRDDICFGLHADITSEWDDFKWGPVSKPGDVPTLVNEKGHFLQFVEDIAARGVDLDDVIREYAAQLARLREVGFAVRYVDGHMAPDFFIPGLADRVDAWARENGLLYVNKARNMLPSCMELPNQPGLFDRVLSQLSQGVYIYVGHPAMYAEEMKRLVNKRNPGDKAARQRERDYRFVTNEETLHTAARHGVIFARYDEALTVERK